MIFFQYSFPDEEFLTFEPVTLVPYEPDLIDMNLLNQDQVRNTTFVYEPFYR